MSVPDSLEEALEEIERLRREMLSREKRETGHLRRISSLEADNEKLDRALRGHREPQVSVRIHCVC